MTRPLLLLFISILSTTGSYTQNLESTLDSLVSPQFKPNEPGVSILVAKKGVIVYEKAFGSANMELNSPLSTDMIFRIGSITKQFTAIAILQLVEQGKISLSDSVQKFIPEFPSKGYTITIEHLLTHTSGILDYSNADTTENPYIERHDFSPLQIIKYFNYQPLEFEPGTKYNYTNSGYVLLGYIIEKVTSGSYHDYMNKHVIGPAGLTHTLYADEATIVPKRVRGYSRNRGFYENCEYQSISIAYACGDLMSNVGDLFKWNNAVISYKLVRKETLDRALTPFRLKDGSFTKYGYGWFIDSSRQSKCIHHEGQINGFIAEEKYFPKEDIYIAILTNVQSGEDNTDFSDNRFRLFESICLAALGSPIVKEAIVSDALLDTYVGKYEATFKKNQSLTIFKKGGRLYADLSNGTGHNMLLVAQSETKFFLPDVKGVLTTFDFIKENGITIQLVATQEKKYVWKKVR